jgi:NAD(P)H-dependent flavin oxidoreductase YrpB (nitropropane dioxygenase family)
MIVVPDVVEAVAPAPVLAAGGIGTGRQMAAGLALGAVGVWTGSIWLTVSEAQTQPAVRDKLLRAGARDTVRSRALTGKPARQLRTAWTDLWDDPATLKPLPMPLQFMLTAEAVYRIYRSEHPDLMGMPVGQIVGRMNEVKPTKQVIDEMVAECAETIERLQGFGR